MKWVFITASFGEERFHESANRLVEQANSIGVFSNVIHVNDSNLEEYAPLVSNKYKSYLNSEHKGFGYFSWKPEIVNTVIERNPGSGVLYIDAGCELNGNLISVLRLKNFMRKTKNGGFFHTLNYAERKYTKKRVLDFFDLSDEARTSPQIQATWFLLAGSKGSEISRRWFGVASQDIRMIDDSTSLEHADFVENRYDQSLLSCLLKSMGIKPRRHRPCFRPVTLVSKVRCSMHPIWSARNRTGISILPKSKGSKGIG